jgi:hypothetical protein
MEGKVLLTGFQMDPAEKAIVDNIIRNYDHKLSERSSYDHLKLRLKTSKKGNNVLHEVEGELKVNKQILSAKSADYNLFSVLADVLDNLLKEMVHRQRK